LILPFSNCENDYRCLPVILTYTQNLISDFIRELAQLTPGDEPCYVCMYVYSHKQSPMYNVNTEQDKKCRTERSYKTLIQMFLYIKLPGSLLWVTKVHVNLGGAREG